MAKLFAREKIVATESAKEPVEEHEENLVEVKDAAEDIETVTKATEMSLERLAVMETIRDSMSGKKLCSDDYMASLENYKPIAAKLGIKCLPEMDDFRNKYAAESAHQYATEGFMEVIKSFWEKIKEFFRSFFKKVAIFFKRILKANLDLESYDKYCDQLVAKLVANKATCTDNSPVGSKLPRYLANKGDAKVDSDFILRVGYTKVGNMIKMLDTLKSSREESILNPAAVKLYEREFMALVEEFKDGFTDVDVSLGRIKTIKERGVEMVTDNFKFQVSSNRLPEEAFTAMRERFSGAPHGTGDPTVYSLCDTESDFNYLPRNTNIFLATMEGQPLWCRGSIEDMSFVEDRIPPIRDVNNLSSLYKTYKNGIAKVDVRTISKSADEVGAVTDHFIHNLSKVMPVLMDKVSPSANSDRAPRDLGGEMVKYLRANKGAIKDFLDWSSLDSSITTSPPDGMDSHNAFRLVEEALSVITTEISSTSDKDMGPHIATVNSLTQDQKDTIWSIFKAAVNGAVGEPSPEDKILLKEALTDLSKTLNQIFTQLQLIYKDIGTLFYQQITEIRYALIKYIYDSAQRFTY